MSEVCLEHALSARQAAFVAPGIASAWRRIRSHAMCWLARQRLASVLSRYDDRLLADIGWGWRDLGFGERLIRSHDVGPLI